jgi:glycosyltransferase involved in cell wall biosynthesis
MPVFSIVIPTYNSSSTLCKALDSVLCQEYEDYELWIIDGASTDNTIEVITKYQSRDNRIKHISEPDRGIYDAMNKGIDAANGDWILFLGSDDQLYDHKVLKKVFEAVQIQTCEVLYGNVLIEGNTAWAKDKSLYDGEFSIKKLFQKNICHQSIFYKTDFLHQEIGYFNLNYRICGDYDYNFRCWAKTKFFYLDQVIARFQGGGESANVVDVNFANDFLKNIRRYFNLSSFDPLLDDSSLWYYPRLLEMQKEENRFRYFMNILRLKIVQKLLVRRREWHSFFYLALLESNQNLYLLSYL